MKHHPLKDLTFCCTSISANKRTEFEKIIKDLGGLYFTDLTSDVKYLIVGNRNTDKYQYCIKLRDDIVYLAPDSIDKLHRDYQSGRDININNYKLPIFNESVLCLSHIIIDDLNKQIESDFRVLINNNGGKATDTLQYSSICLITNERKGKRYQKALEWKTPIVHPIFLINSIKKGALLDFNDYLLDNYPNYLNLSEPVHNKNLKIKKHINVWDSIMNTSTSTISSNVIVNSSTDSTTTTKSSKSQIFTGVKFKLVNFGANQAKILSDIITSHDGEIVSDNANYNLIPFGKSIPNDSQYNETFKTEWLIERSMYYSKLIDDEWSNPVPKFNINHEFDISVSGFKGIELLHLTKLLTELGFKVNDNFNSKMNLLFINVHIYSKKLPSKLFENPMVQCPFDAINVVSTKNKILASKSWSIPILSINYLFEILKTSEASISYPNLKDLSWCLYYPSSVNGNEFIEFLNGKDSDSIKLPSPKKVKRKFGKLITDNKPVNTESSTESVIDDFDFDLGIGYEGRKRKK